MTVAPLAVPPRRIDEACASAGGWLRALLDAPPAIVQPGVSLWLALGASLCCDARAADAALDRADAAAILCDELEGDALAGALAFALAARTPGAALRALLLRHAGATPARRAAVGILLRDRDARAPSPPGAAEAQAALLGAASGAVAETADALEAFGVRDDAATEELVAAAAARGFAELRAHRAFALGTTLLRVAATLRPDPLTVGYVNDYLFALQRRDGAFGHLPPRSPQAGDLRIAFHLPRTVRSLWTLRDAEHGGTILRREVARAARRA